MVTHVSSNSLLIMSLNFPVAPEYTRLPSLQFFTSVLKLLEENVFMFFCLLVLMDQASLMQEVTHHSYSTISSLNSFSIPG